MEPDLFNPNTGLTISYAGCAIVGKDGEVSISRNLREEATLSGFPFPEFQYIGEQLNEKTLLDARYAEVHLVFRHHSEVIPRLVYFALQTFNGACIFEPSITGLELACGAHGLNNCADTFFVVFPSPAAP